MAGDWIKVEEALPDKPEVWQIAATLQIDADAVVGKLVRVWVWASRSCHGDGVTNVTARPAIDRIAGVTGFSAAMQAAGWLIATEDTLQFPNFDRHNSKTSKERALATKRQTARRVKPGPGVTEVSRSHRDKNVTREEKRREENTDIPPNPPSGGKGGKKQFDPRRMPIPDELSTPEFHRAWSEWCAYRSAKRKPISEIAAKKQINKLLAYGPVAAVAAIEKAMESDWQSVHPEGLGSGSHARNGSDDLFGGLREFVERHEQYEHEQS